MALSEILNSGQRRSIGGMIARLQGATGQDGEIYTRSCLEEDLRGAVASEYRAPFLSVPCERIDPGLLETFESFQLSSHRFVPVLRQDGLLVVATSQPWNVSVRDAVSQVMPGIDISLLYISDENLQGLFDGLKLEKASYATKATEAVKSASVESAEAGHRIDLNSEAAGEIDAVVRSLLRTAVEKNASDIQLQPKASGSYRIRIDNGVLHDLEEIPREIAGSVQNRIFNLTTSMNPERRHRSQDGNIQLTYGVGNVDCRLQSLPAYQPGGSTLCHITIRLQNSVKRSEIRLEKLDFGTEELEEIQRAITSPGAFCVVSGPTGSGKTTTLGACLHYLNQEDRQIYSVENPVENFVDGVTHIQIQDFILSFDDALRALLRMKPDALLIGEIRDEITAKIAMQASDTGHIVLATLHVDYAYQIPHRLRRLGVDAYSAAQQVRLYSSQRLLSLLCENCAGETEVRPDEVRRLRLPASLSGRIVKTRNPLGCAKCTKGYAGRQPIIEVIPVTDDFRELVANPESTLRQIREYVYGELKVRSLADKAIRLVESGVTDLHAVRKVLNF